MAKAILDAIAGLEEKPAPTPTPTPAPQAPAADAGQKANHEKQDGIQQEKQEEDPDKYQAEEKEDRTKISK